MITKYMSNKKMSVQKTVKDRNHAT